MSFIKKLTIVDILFWVQIVFAFEFCRSQCVGMLRNTEGINITWFISWIAFSSLNFFLTLHLNKGTAKNKMTTYLLWSYGIWGMGAVACASVMIVTGSGIWNIRDWLNLGIVAGGILAVSVVARKKGLPILPYPDPIVKGWFALCFKSLPQVVLAINIAIIGGGRGLSAGAVWIGHITVCIRLGQLIYTWWDLRCKGATDRNCNGSLLSEIGNEISWIMVTVAWLLN